MSTRDQSSEQSQVAAILDRSKVPVREIEERSRSCIDFSGRDGERIVVGCVG
jgi:hypothetical protein